MSAFTDLSAEILAKSLDKESWNQLEFVQTVFNDRTINEVALTPWAGGGGLNADSNILTIKRSTGATGDDAPDSGATEGEQRVFVKLTDAGRAPMSKAVGLSREGLVYGAIANHGSELLKSLIPRVYFGHGDMSTGRKVVVMELVDGVQAGYFYGAQSLHNWGKDLTNLLADYPAFDELAVTLQCFRRAADLHSAYWGKPEEACKDLPELRSADWMRGEGQESWNTVLEQARVGVELVRGDGASKLGITLNPDFMKVIEASFAKTTWESYQEMFAKIPKMLFHGDYHPSNIIVRRPTADQPKAEPNIVVVDLEVIGIGSGPQDLGQFHMSHNSPESRRKNTDVVLQAYLDRLTEKGVSTTLEHVKSEYVNGGFGRWMWLFPAILTMGLPAPALQFFHDQTWAFAQDHNITPENAPLVRP